jgi:Mrp family chromosome partitioning ATPase
MFRRRPKPPVLARIPGRHGRRRAPGALDRAELEAFDALRRSVGPSHITLLTGNRDGSWIAIGLATALVADGRRVALVECDFARPTLASRLGLAEGPGLADYLRYEAEASEILQAIVLAGPASGHATAPLVCVVAGAPTSHGPTLLSSEDFQHALAKLRSAYDCVVLDGPPFEDELSLASVAPQVDLAIACGEAPRVPKRLRDHVDGVIVVEQRAEVR